jgi:tRNA(Arg) A34 adenosine deaminase TadA
MSMPITSSSTPPKELIKSILATVENNVIPLTQQGASTGSKLFGAAIPSRSTLQPHSVATNNERLSPLLHGEINCIQQFFTIDVPDPSNRPDPRTDCIFFATHEPCSLCLSGIAWAGFSEVYFMFTYEDSRDLFGIPYDIEILQEIFRVKGSQTSEQVGQRALYNRENKFFRARSLAEIVGDIADGGERGTYLAEIERVKKLYDGLSETYQDGKDTGAVTSSIWK